MPSQPVRYGYDTMGRMKELRTTRDGSAFDATRWLYNPVTGLVTNKLYADYSTIAYAYTDDGKPHRTTWARGAWKGTAYDSRELPVGVSYSDDTPSVFMAYNDLQYLVAASNFVARYAYLHTNLGITTNETASIAGSSHVIARGLDEYQRLRQLTVDGRDSATYSYDDENCLSGVSNAVFSVAYHYTSDGHDAGYTTTLTNGVALNRAVVRDAYRRQLVSLVSNEVDSAAVSSYQYGYDTLARATNRNDDSFGYNARSEITEVSILSNAYSYAYDFIGNHTTSSVDAVETTYVANNLNQYSQISVPSVPSVDNLSYDLDGNMLTNGVWTYTWDAENRLTAAYSNSLCVVSNAYDYMGRRVVKTTPPATHTFVYDGWNLVQESISTASGTTTNFFVWGKDLSGTMQSGGGVGGLLAVKQGNAWYCPFYDINGNITAYVDVTGAVVAEYAYDAFGGTIAQSGSMEDTFMHRFSTKYFDVETGLYYYGYRFYDPVLHRWLNRDPIEEGGGFNLYAFCGNNGVNRWDYLGLNLVDVMFIAQELAYKAIRQKWDTMVSKDDPGYNLGLSLVSHYVMRKGAYVKNGGEWKGYITTHARGLRKALATELRKVAYKVTKGGQKKGTRSEVTNATILTKTDTYAYDDIGNHTASSVDSVSTTYTANAFNQYTAILCTPAPLREPSYDLDGNMLTNGVWSYTWDCENRLTTVYSNSVCAVSNAYDYMSRRVTKWTPSHSTTYVYDGWNLVMEIQSSNIPPFQSSTNTYVWGKDLSGSLQGAGGIGGLLAVSLDGTWYFPFYDNNGNITAYVGESGSVVAEYAYDAFGGLIASSGPIADAFAHRFSTKYLDSETGLYYYGYRFYSSAYKEQLNGGFIGKSLTGICLRKTGASLDG